MSKGKPKVRQRAVYVWTFYDLEASGEWGSDDKPLPLCVVVGFVYRRPVNTDPLPFWRIMSSWSEDEPGTETKVPVAMLKRKRLLGTVEIPWR